MQLKWKMSDHCLGMTSFSCVIHLPFCPTPKGKTRKDTANSDRTGQLQWSVRRKFYTDIEFFVCLLPLESRVLRFKVKIIFKCILYYFESIDGKIDLNLNLFKFTIHMSLNTSTKEEKLPPGTMLAINVTSPVTGGAGRSYLVIYSLADID